jgi:hypothetical protein
MRHCSDTHEYTDAPRDYAWDRALMRILSDAAIAVMRHDAPWVNP